MNKKLRAAKLRQEITGILTKEQSPFLTIYQIVQAFKWNNLPHNEAALKKTVRGALEVFENTHRKSDGGAALNQFLATVIDGKKPARKARDDNERSRGNFAGKHPSKIWDLLRKADDILSLKYKDEWVSLGVKGGEEWVDLLSKISDVTMKDTPPLPQNIGYSYAAIDRMLDEMIILAEVHNEFIKKVEKARKNPEKGTSKTFLNTIKAVYGNKATEKFFPFIAKEIPSRRPIRAQTLTARNRRIKEMISTGDIKLATGRDYLDLNTRLAYMALYIDELFSIPVARLEYEIERLKKISDAKATLKKYGISPLELLEPSDIETLGKEIGKAFTQKGIGAKAINPLK